MTRRCRTPPFFFPAWQYGIASPLLFQRQSAHTVTHHTLACKPNGWTLTSLPGCPFRHASALISRPITRQKRQLHRKTAWKMWRPSRADGEKGSRGRWKLTLRPHGPCCIAVCLCVSKTGGNTQKGAPKLRSSKAILGGRNRTRSSCGKEGRKGSELG